MDRSDVDRLVGSVIGQIKALVSTMHAVAAGIELEDREAARLVREAADRLWGAARGLAEERHQDGDESRPGPQAVKAEDLPKVPSP